MTCAPEHAKEENDSGQNIQKNIRTKEYSALSVPMPRRVIPYLNFAVVIPQNHIVASKIRLLVFSPCNLAVAA